MLHQIWMIIHLIKFCQSKTQRKHSFNTGCTIQVYAVTYVLQKKKDILNHGSDTNVELKQNLLVRIRFLIVGSITSMSFQLL
jgi:hypothetical protein